MFIVLQNVKNSCFIPCRPHSHHAQKTWYAESKTMLCRSFFCRCSDFLFGCRPLFSSDRQTCRAVVCNFLKLKETKKYTHKSFTFRIFPSSCNSNKWYDIFSCSLAYNCLLYYILKQQDAIHWEQKKNENKIKTKRKSPQRMETWKLFLRLII